MCFDNFISSLSISVHLFGLTLFPGRCFFSLSLCVSVLLLTFLLKVFLFGVLLLLTDYAESSRFFKVFLCLLSYWHLYIWFCRTCLVTVSDHSTGVFAVFIIFHCLLVRKRRKRMRQLSGAAGVPAEYVPALVMETGLHAAGPQTPNWCPCVASFPHDPHSCPWTWKTTSLTGRSVAWWKNKTCCFCLKAMLPMWISSCVWSGGVEVKPLAVYKFACQAENIILKKHLSWWRNDYNLTEFTGTIIIVYHFFFTMLHLKY